MLLPNHIVNKNTHDIVVLSLVAVGRPDSIPIMYRFSMISDDFQWYTCTILICGLTKAVYQLSIGNFIHVECIKKMRPSF